MIIFLYLCTDITQQRNNMENPFVFGKAAEGAYFTDRVEDSKRLAANLTHGLTLPSAASAIRICSHISLNSCISIENSESAPPSLLCKVTCFSITFAPFAIAVMGTVYPIE